MDCTQPGVFNICSGILRIHRKTVEIYINHSQYLNIFCHPNPTKFIQHLGADFKNNQTTIIIKQFIWTNREVETKLYLLPIGPNRIV